MRSSARLIMSQDKRKVRSSAERWVAEEDEELRLAYLSWQATNPTGLCPWKQLAAKVSGGHTPAQCGTVE